MEFGYNAKKLYLYSIIQPSYISQLLLGGNLRFNVCLAHNPSQSGFRVFLNPDDRIVSHPEIQCQNKPLTMKNLK